MKFKNKNAFSIIEILIVVFVIVLALTSILGVATFSLRISVLIQETGQANSLAQETMEAVRNFRDGTSWNSDGLGTLNAGIFYYLQKSSDNPSEWQIIPGQETINGFNRKVVFNSVQRDSEDNIVEAGGVNDPNTRKVIVTVSWKDKEVEIVTYLTNWR